MCNFQTWSTLYKTLIHSWGKSDRVPRWGKELGREVVGGHLHSNLCAGFVAKSAHEVVGGHDYRRIWVDWNSTVCLPACSAEAARALGDETCSTKQNDFARPATYQRLRTCSCTKRDFSLELLVNRIFFKSLPMMIYAYNIVQPRKKTYEYFLFNLFNHMHIRVVSLRTNLSIMQKLTTLIEKGHKTNPVLDFGYRIQVDCDGADGADKG